ncbi:MAG TPA: HlyD family secretion protein [Acetobacteraceae bacterium]|jgi:membrane fusion protein, multidrug efflux system|nr:HlyD family secretion protein [Acetobacteraceae bacterium]
MHQDTAIEKEQVRVSERSYSDRQTRTRRLRLPLRSILLGAAGAGALAGAILYGQYYWTTGQFLVSTDDAYVQAHSVLISPKVSGYISDVAVDDNQKVRSGEVLARIDDRDYRTAVAVARADVEAQQAAIDTLIQQIAAQQQAVEAARDNITADQADLTFANQDFARYQNLSRSGAGSVQEAQRATSLLQAKRAALDHDTADLALAQRQIDVLKAQQAQAQAMLGQRQAALHQAELNESYTTITAPVDGTVGVRTVRVGQYVQAGTQLMAVVPLRQVYVTANYKETQLTDVHKGQPVTIDIDTFPGDVVHGTVNSIAPASGEEFALLPPDNATGNFTKIVQRIPVKITINPDDPLIGRLRPGMSVEPTIDTKPAKG